MPGLHIPSVKAVLYSVGKAIGYHGCTPHINEFHEEVLMNILLLVLCPSLCSTRIRSTEDIPLLSALTEDTPVVSFNVQTSPFPLSQVCRLWRKIVTTKSSFWRSISLVEPSEKHLHRTQLWMERAGSQRLDIQVYQYSNPSEVKRAYFEAVFDILCTRARQWSTLLIKLDEYMPNRLLCNDLPFNNLREATILLGSSVHLTAQESAWSCLRSAQSLRALTFSSSFTPHRALCSSLRELLLTVPMTVMQVARQARFYPDLQSLQVTICDDPSFTEYTPSPRIATLSKLQELFIDRVSNTELVGFFDQFSLPSLVSITVQGMSQVECDALWELLEDSQCTLRILSIGLRHGLSSDNILEWFDHDCLENLETLLITGAVPLTNDILLQLHCPSRRGRKSLYFPKMKHLGLIKCHADINENDLISMLGSRYWIMPALGIDVPLLKTELRTAVVVVEEKTHEMRMYERMINQCARTMMDFTRTKYVWRDRKLTITQA